MQSLKIKLLSIGKQLAPGWLTRWLRNKLEFQDWETESRKKNNPYVNDPDEYIFENSTMKAGIFYNQLQYHKHWIAACRELKVSYQIIYLEKADWMEQIEKSGCDVFLVWPDIRSQEIKQMWDERLRILVEEMNGRIYPSLKEIWLYENKRVQHYWLKTNGFKTPGTKVFYNEKEAVEFLQNAQYPLVLKSNLGASASGVYIENTPGDAIKKAKQFFKHGYSPKRNAAGKKQKGSIYIQEYIPDTKEWRMVRIGDSYFGHGKDMRGQFHSGSGKANFDLPPAKAFELLKEITQKGNLSSMDVDLFEDKVGNFYVNELQTVFGNSIAKEQMKINGVPGRYLIKSNGDFQFEAGSFCENHLCNLRLEYILKNLNLM